MRLLTPLEVRLLQDADGAFNWDEWLSDEELLASERLVKRGLLVWTNRLINPNDAADVAQFCQLTTTGRLALRLHYAISVQVAA